jgi:hypothetical protein
MAVTWQHLQLGDVLVAPTTPYNQSFTYDQRALIIVEDNVFDTLPDYYISDFVQNVTVPSCHASPVYYHHRPPTC